MEEMKRLLMMRGKSTRAVPLTTRVLGSDVREWRGKISRFWLKTVFRKPVGLFFFCVVIFIIHTDEEDNIDALSTKAHIDREELPPVSRLRICLQEKRSKFLPLSVIFGGSLTVLISVSCINHQTAEIFILKQGLQVLSHDDSMERSLIPERWRRHSTGRGSQEIGRGASDRQQWWSSWCI